MANDDPCNLICLIEGDSSPFMVESTGSMRIMKLKQLVKENGINTTEHTILAKDLILWKVRMTTASGSTNNLSAG